MPVCPKCGFAGHNPDTCERCGVIFSRIRPDGHGGTPVSVRPVTRERIATPIATSAASPTPNRVAPVSREAGLKGGKAPGAELGLSSPGITPAEVQIIPPPPRPKSRAPLFIGLLAACLVLWGLSVWRDHHRRSEGADETADSVQDAEYYDIAVSSLVDDTRARFRHPATAATLNGFKDDLFKRERYLKVKLTNAPMSDAHRSALNSALDDVAIFLKAQVIPSRVEVAAAQIPGATDLSRLDHASGLLSSLPQ